MSVATPKAIEQDRFEAFLADVEEAGDWPPGLEFLARTLSTLHIATESPLTA